MQCGYDLSWEPKRVTLLGSYAISVLCFPDAITPFQVTRWSLVLALPTVCRLSISLSLAPRNPESWLVFSSPLTSSHVIATLLLEGIIYNPEFQGFACQVRDRSLYPPSDFQTLAEAQKRK